MRTKLIAVVVLMICAQVAPGVVRIKDIASVQGVRNQQLIGYGLALSLIHISEPTRPY